MKMRPTRVFGLAMVAAIAATAFVGASSATALEPTQLCWTHTEPCTNPVEGLFSMLAKNVVLLTSLFNILCLHSVLEAEPLELGNPQVVHVHSLDFLECGTNEEHNNCTKTVIELPLLDVLKTELNLGTAKLLGGKVNVKCGFIINCTYGGTVEPLVFEGAEHTEGAGNGKLIANGIELAEGEGFACPATVILHASYEALKPLYLVS